MIGFARKPVRLGAAAAAVAVVMAGTGLFLWMRLPDGRDAAELARRALRHNIVLAPGNVFSPAHSWPDTLRFNAPQSQHQRLFEFLRAELKSRA